MLNCKHCGKECINKNSLAQHERLCKQNPNRDKPSNGMLGKKGSNQFIKAQELGLPVPPGTMLGKPGTFSNRKHKEETKKLISERRLKFLEENPDKVPYKLNHSSKESYPEKYFNELFLEENIVFEKEHPVGLYSLDFAILSKKIDIEIDGEQHYCDPRIVESDKRRNEYLTSLGWEIIRIRWSDYKKMLDSDKKAFIIDLMKKLDP